MGSRSIRVVAAWLLVACATPREEIGAPAPVDSGAADVAGELPSPVAPTVAIVSPAPGATLLAGAQVTLRARVTDDHDLEGAAVRWASSLAGSLGEAPIEAGEASLVVGALASGTHVLAAEVTDADGLTGRASVEVTVQAAVGAPEVSIQPDSPTTLDDLQAVVPPAAGATPPLRTDWFVDGQAVPALAGATSVSADRTARDQTWLVRAAFGSGPVGTAQVTIRNSPPQCVQAQLSPETPTVLTPLTCGCAEGSDADDDAFEAVCTLTVNGAPVAADGCVLPAGAAARGDEVGCSVRLQDHADLGPATLATPRTIVGSPPTAPTVALSPLQADVTTSVTCEIAVPGTDPDGDTVSHGLSWSVNGHVNPGLAEPVVVAGALTGPSGQPAGKGDAIRCGASASTADGASAVVWSPPLVLKNAAPTAASAVITPNAPTETDVLTCTPTGTDPDGDPIHWTLAWTVNTAPAGQGATLDGATFDKGQVITCIATPDDGVASGSPVQSVSVIAVNSPPSLAQVGLTPSAPTRDETLTCAWSGWSDPDPADQTPAVSIAWWVGGAPLPGAAGATLSAADLSPGTTVQCRVTPSDGALDGPPVASPLATVTNQPPLLLAVTIAPAQATSSDTLTCVPVGYYDPDADTLDFAYVWRVDGAVVAGQTGPTLPPGHAVRGQAVTCEITPHDGFDAGPAVASKARFIANSPPVLQAVTVSPEAGGVLSAWTCAVTAVDADGDALTPTWAWLVSGTVVPGAHGATFAGALLAPGDLVACRASVSDGQASSAPQTSVASLVSNGPPSITGARIEPDPLTAAGPATCVPEGWADPDGDPASLQVVWFVSGEKVAGQGGATLPASAFARGDQVVCEALPVDPVSAGGAALSAPVMVVNAPPVITAVTMSAATEVTPPTCAVSTADADGDDVSVAVTWAVDGASAPGPSLSGAHYHKGQVLTCVATAHDGFEASAPHSATGVVQNAPPAAAGAIIEPAAPTVTDTLTCVASGLSDPDGDPVQPSVQWLVDGVAAGAGPTLAPGTLSAGAVVRCVVTPADAEAAGPSVQSSPVVVADTPPVVVAATVTPSDGGRLTPFECVATGAADPDGQPVSVMVSWWLDDVLAGEGAVFTPLAGTPGQALTCRVTPHAGGLDGAPVVSAAVLLGNSPPTLAGAVILPAAPTSADTLQCATSGFFDADEHPDQSRVAWWVDGVPAAPGPADPGGGGLPPVARGSVVICQATPFDGFAEGVPVVSPAVEIANAPPTIGWVSLASGEAGITCAAHDVSDPDGDPVTVSWTWFVDGAPAGSGPTLASPPGAGQTVRCDATPHDGLMAGPVSVGPQITVGNAPPSVTGAIIEPSAPDRTTPLTCAPEGWSDPEGAPAGAHVTWWVGGAPASAGATLAPGSYQRGDTVRCRLVPFDGASEGSPVFAQVVIGNAPPAVASAAVTPDLADRTTPLTCQAVDVSDPDGDPVTLAVTWTVAGASAPAASPFVATMGQRGDSVTCAVVPTDAYGLAGAPAVSPPITLENAPPMLKVTVLPDPLFTHLEATCQVVATDPDGDPVSVARHWTVAGTPSPVIGEVLPASAFARGQLIACRAVATDALGGVTEVTGQRTVANHPPVVDQVTVTPTAPGALDAVTCQASAGDADADEITVSYAWQVDGVPAGAGDTLPPGSAVRDQVVTCIASPADAEDAGVPAAASVTVVNTPPSVASAAVSPTAPRVSDPVTCKVAGWADPDGDPPQLQFRWFRDGAVVSGAVGATFVGSLVRGQSLACEVTPADPFGPGDPVTSAAVTIRNSPPSLAGAAIAPVAPTAADALHCQPLGYADADGDAPAHAYAWEIDDATLSGAAGPTLAAGTAEQGQSVRCRVTPGDGLTSGVPVFSPAVVIGNAGPVIASVAVSPGAGPYCGTFQCVVEAADADGEALSTTVAWDLDGQPAGMGPSITVGATPGQALTCRVEVSDGEAVATGASSPVILDNAPPTLTSATLVPEAARVGEGLHCQGVGFQGPECSPPPAIVVEWTVDGQPIDHDLETLATLGMAVGTTIRCTVRPFDGFVQGAVYTSNLVSLRCPAGACDDGDPCTHDQCSDADGACSHAPVDCDDDDPCTIDGCGPTGCVHAAVSCDDGDPCTTDHCGPTGCQSAPLDCEDGDPCTLEHCDAGWCYVAIDPCDDGDPCTSDHCDPTAALRCVNLPLGAPCGQPCAGDAACDDGNPCTADACAGGVCANTPPDCEDGSTCTFDHCLPATGECVSEAIPGCAGCLSNASCHDDDPCTQNLCDPFTHACYFPPVPDCSPCAVAADCGDPPSGPNRCMVAACVVPPGGGLGQCTWTGRTCYDGVVCTLDGCEADSGCQFRTTGECETGCESAADCNDGNPCTEDQCHDGECALTAVSCDDDDPCTRDYCDPRTGACLHPPAPGCDDQGGDCETAADCAVADQCLMTSCYGPPGEGRCLFEVRGCNDYDPCTADACDPAVGCVATPVSSECPEGLCTVVGDCHDDNLCSTDACVDGQCAAACGAHHHCDDGDPATLDTCQDGRCEHAPGAPCSSDADCWEGDGCQVYWCDAGTCRSRPVLCDDGLACTRDFAACEAAIDSVTTSFKPDACAGGDPRFVPACVPEEGCLNLPVLNCGAQWLASDEQLLVPCETDAPCATGHPCAPGACVEGQCVVTPVQCPQPGPGKMPYCDYQTGACKTLDRPGWTGCGTDADCRVKGQGVDRCSRAYCDLSASPPQCVTFEKPCDDRDPCTVDGCHPDKGCSYDDIPGCVGCATDADCDDGDPCTAETCEAGACTYPAVPGCLSCADPVCASEGGVAVCLCLPGEVPVCPAVYCQRDADCADDSTCTLDRCLPNGACEHRAIDCLENEGCKSPFGECVEGVGCRSTPRPDCDRPCTQDLDCDTGSQCQVGRCEAGACVVESTPCGDDDPCTVDLCREADGGCVHVADPLCAGACAEDADCPKADAAACGPAQCVSGECWQLPAACNDYDPCTADFCNDGACVFAPIPGCQGCLTDGDCDDGNGCTANTCGDDGDCTFTLIDGCLPCFADADCPPGPDPCHVSRCDLATLGCVIDDLGPDCVACNPLADAQVNAAQCSDGLLCTVDYCDPDTSTCRRDLDESLPGCAPTPCASTHECQQQGPCVLEYCDFDRAKPACAHKPLPEAIEAVCPVPCEIDGDCLDGDPCTVDRCDPLLGQCAWTAKDCVDDAPCSLDHHCTEAGCEFLPDAACDAWCETNADCATGDPCAVGTCQQHQCVVSVAPGCPGAGCTQDAQCPSTPCARGVCLGGTCLSVPVDCDDSSPCTEDTCGPSGCEFALIPGCTLGCETPADCDDDDVNTQDVCEAGHCRNHYLGPPCTSDLECYDTNACTYEHCNPQGRCESRPVLCYDGLDCTKDLAPCGGIRSDISSEPVYPNCDPANGQPVACDPTAGCYFLPVENCGNGVDGVWCDTDADCDTGHACWPGVCVSGKCLVDAITCPTPPPDEQAFCSPETGQCTVVDQPGWSFCNVHADCRHVPDMPIAGFHKCEIAFCNRAGKNPQQKQCRYFDRNCDDLNPCTLDTCDPAVGCVFTPIPGCQGCSADAHCNDFDPCTLDACDESSHRCTHLDIPACARCTVETQDVHCFDGDDCTKDLCDEGATPLINTAGVCHNPPFSVEERPGCYASCATDRDCVDQNPCTIDRCDAATGLCSHDKPVCRDGLPCTDDHTGCDPARAGCRLAIDPECSKVTCSSNAGCAFPNPCFVGSCKQGDCDFDVTVCNDGSPATRDVCDPYSGACRYDPVAGGFSGCTEVPEGLDSPECDDGDACTIDGCFGLGCYYLVMPCQDFDPCTTDACDPAVGCVFQPIDGCTGCLSNAECDDGDACTTDTCQGGNCRSTPVTPVPAFCK